MKNLTFETFWLSWRALYLYVPISFLSIPVALANTSVTLGQNIQLSIALSALTLAVLAALVPLGQVLPRNAWVRGAVFAIVVSLVGALRGWVLTLQLAQMDVPDGRTSLARISSSAISTLIWLILIAAIDSALAANRLQYRERFAARALTEASTVPMSETDVAKQIDGLQNIKALKASLSQIAEMAKQDQVSENRLLVAAASLRNEIENSLRPLSHRIWFNENQNRPQFRIAGLLAQALRKVWFYPVPTATIGTLWFIAGAYNLGPIAPVIFKAVSTGLLILLATTIAQRRLAARTLGVGQGLAVFVGIATFSHGFSSLLVWLVTRQNWVADSLTSLVLLSISVAAVLLLLSALHSLQSDLGLVNQVIDEAELSDDGQLKSRFAGYLHNSLQAELTGLAMRLEQASSSGTSAAEAVARLEEIAQRSIGSDFANRDSDPNDRLARVVAGWDGIADIRLNVCPELAQDQRKLALFVEIVEESVANAVRHASAKSIEISTAVAEGGIEILVTNPVNRKTAAKSSLGDAWLKRFAVSYSSRQEGGTYYLRVIL